MKPTLAILTCCTALLVGCTTGTDGKRKLSMNVFTRTTNLTHTASILRAAATNYVTEGSNVFVTVSPAVVQTNYVTNILVEVAPAVGSTIEIAAGLNGSLNPTPTAPFVNIALTAITGLLGLVAAWKTKAANRANASNAETNAVLEAVVTGVEVIKDDAARKLAKDSVTQISETWKMRDRVRDKVDSLTP